MKILIASDHAGVRLKEQIKDYLKRKRISYEDFGTNTLDPVDYPDYAFRVAERVAKEKDARGILICGTGTGMTIAANKVRGVRAAAASDVYSAKMSRVDNDTNILGLRGRYFPYRKALAIIGAWLKTPFSGKHRHRNRLRKIADYENR